MVTGEGLHYPSTFADIERHQASTKHEGGQRYRWNYKCEVFRQQWRVGGAAAAVPEPGV